MNRNERYWRRDNSRMEVKCPICNEMYWVPVWATVTTLKKRIPNVCCSVECTRKGNDMGKVFMRNLRQEMRVQMEKFKEVVLGAKRG